MKGEKRKERVDFFRLASLQIPT